MRVGSILGNKYEILKEIGQGGMSIVYLAMDVKLNKQWAVKEIKQGTGKDTNTLFKSLQMEAMVLKNVDHPVLPRIVDIVEEQGTVFVVMDYIEGKTMDAVLRQDGAQPQEQVVRWAKQLCSALSYLHSMNPPIVYRDMKPSNIMLKPDGTVKLIDFGTAKELDEKSLADTTALGTKGYAAPEQFGDANGRGIYKTDIRTDIYSLGATLYHLLTGKNPNEPPYVIKPIRYWNAALSSGLEKIICKCTMPDPENRYQNCEELNYDLEHFRELEDAFKRVCFNKIRQFLVWTGFTVFFGAVAIAGFIGLEHEKRNNYENLIRSGYSYTAKGEYEKAVKVYEQAITELDGGRNTAYLELMNLYINYINDAELGLSRIAYYIDQEYQDIQKDQELLLKVAMNYFEVLKDYKSSACYFNMLDVKQHPEAEYYSSIALAMGQLNVDYNLLLENLQQFERINDDSIISVNKLMNYRLLCIVYARNLKQMDCAAKCVVQVAQKGISLLEEYEEDGVKAEYYVVFNQYLALAYEYLGETLAKKDAVMSREYYEKAIACCDFILSMVNADETRTIGSVTDYQLREAKYCQKAAILEALGEYKEACEIYERAENEYEWTSINLYVGHLSLLCSMQEKKTADVELWDYDTLYTLYKEGKRVEGIEDDYRWKQLTQKLSALFEQREE